VTTYRAFKIKNDRIEEAPIIIEVETDALAIEKAKQLVDGCDVQLWAEGDRFVIGFRGSGTTEPQ
jgi:hypothetical protein